MLEFLSRSRETKATGRDLRLIAAACSVDGSARSVNQDAWGIDSESRVLAIADGIGGGECGGIASRLAVDTLLHELTNRNTSSWGREESMSVAFSAAAESIRSSAASRNCSRMGTTAVCAVLNGVRLTLGWTGDSRAYLLRNGRARLLTHDHTFAQKLADVGAISDEAVSAHSYRNTLWNFVGVGDASGIPETKTLDLQRDDRLILATDGVTGPLDEQEIARIVAPTQSPQVAVRNLVSAALEGGSTDDATCLVALAESC